MDIGIFIPQVGIDFPGLLERARRCERLGFHSMWLFDHLYSPGLPDRPALEGWTLATALLARTHTLRVGHLVLDNNLRHPALLGRMISTLDHIAPGRFEVGIGSGSYETEHLQGGFPWGPMAERAGRLEESLAILTAMLSGTPTTFAGAHYQVADLPNVPAPAVRPRLYIGGAGPRYTLPLVARYADVWNVPTYALGRWAAASADLDTACAAIGRDPASILKSLEAVLVVGADDAAVATALARAERRYPGAAWGLHDGGFIGTPGAIVERLRRLEEEGIGMCVVFPADRGEGDMMELLATEVLPHL